MKDLLPIVVAVIVGILGLVYMQTQVVLETPTVSDLEQYTIQEFLGNTNFNGFSFSPDNSKVLVSSDEYGILNAFAVPVDGSRIEKITSSNPNSLRVVSYFPDDERFLFLMDEGGNELLHVFVRELNGDVFDLTPGLNVRSLFAGWSGDGSKFYLTSNERDPRFLDVYEYDTETYERTRIFENNDAYGVSDVSSDGRFVALNQLVTNANNNMYLFDRQSGETELISAHEGDVFYGGMGFSPNDRYLLYTTDEGSEFRYLMRLDLADGSRQTMFEADWDLLWWQYSPSGSYFAVAINNDARTEVKLFNASTMAPIALPDMGSIDITGMRFSHDERGVAFYASSSSMPSDLFYLDLEDWLSRDALRAAQAVRQLTHSLNPNIEPSHLVEGEVVRFESFDGLEVPGILYMPKQASPNNKVPALVWVHGGPGGQSRIGYFGLIQYLVNHGYAIYAINNRGSFGYGKTFFHLDDKLHGTVDLDDCVWSKQMLIDTGLVDPDRIGIIGGSYGGYMTLAALTFRPEEFAVGVDLFGISNWQRTIESVPPWWEAIRAWLRDELGPLDDPEFFRAKSPLFHSEKIVKPLMVLQGANDPRVLQQESDDIVAAVRANGVPVEYIVFEDEGHGFVKKENQEEGFAAILAFLNQYLR